jgi:Asp-tRNA(Asn)/Glu-tRNA(Gln) amidotransferase A subunit family amidase
MCDFALGTQTQGSVIRPASYCGVCGFKPGYGLLPLEGALPFAPSLDTAGLFTSTAREMAALWEKLGFGDAAEFPSRLAFWPGGGIEPEMRAAFSDGIARLRAIGFRLEPIDLSPEWEELLACVRIVNAWEGARTHEERFRRYGDAIGEKLAALIEEGLSIPAETHDAALAGIAGTKRRLGGLPVVLTPAATGPAPRGLASTGDPRMNAPWTALGGPVVTVPMPVAGLPLGMQVAAGSGSDALALRAAVEIESGLTSSTRNH